MICVDDVAENYETRGLLTETTEDDMEEIEWRSRMTRNPGNCCWCGIYCCQRDDSDTCGGPHCTEKVAGVHEVAARLFLITDEGKCAEE